MKKQTSGHHSFPRVVDGSKTQVSLSSYAYSLKYVNYFKRAIDEEQRKNQTEPQNLLETTALFRKNFQNAEGAPFYNSHHIFNHGLNGDVTPLDKKNVQKLNKISSPVVDFMFFVLGLMIVVIILIFASFQCLWIFNEELYRTYKKSISRFLHATLCQILGEDDNINCNK